MLEILSGKRKNKQKKNKNQIIDEEYEEGEKEDEQK